MKIIRKNTFETNSSSTHSLVISLDKKFEYDGCYNAYEIPTEFCRTEFVNLSHWNEKLAFIYAMLEWYENSEFTIDRLKEQTLKAAHRFVEIVKESSKRELHDYEQKALDVELFTDIEKTFKCLQYSDIYSEIYPDKELLTKLFTDVDYMASYLFNRDSYVVLGGDEYRGQYIRTIGHEYDYECTYHTTLTNGEELPKEWFDENNSVKDEFWEVYINTPTHHEPVGEFWDKLEEYKKSHDVYFVGAE